MMATTKKKQHKYVFKPKVIQSAVIVASHARLQSFALQRKILKDRMKGMDYDDIADKHNVSADEAFKIAQEGIQRWAKELGETASQAKAIDLQRMDAMIAVISPEVFPEPCFDALTGAQIKVVPNPVFVKLYLDILARRAAMLGTDAAKKMDIEGDDTKALQRVYIGGDPTML